MPATPTTLGALLLAAFGFACGSAGELPVDAGGPVLDAGPPPVRAVYELGPAPMRFGAVPWPDGAYTDAEGRVRVREIPTQADAAYVEALADSLAQLDGFGTTPTIYFGFDGDVDPDTLPRQPDDTLEDDASVFLLDADTSSPEAFTRVAVDVDYDPDSRRVRLRPAFGRALNPGRLYAAVLTDRVRGEDGRPVVGAGRFQAIRDAETPLSDALERAARARYTPVLETLARDGMPRQRVSAMAVFRVQSVRSDLADARQLVRGATAGAASIGAVVAGTDLDAVLGTPLAGTIGLDVAAPHEHIGYMIHGRFDAPNLLATNPGMHGAFERNASGALVVKRREAVPFSLFLPQGLAAGARLPIVLVQHGLMGDRSDALALANGLAASGYAVFALDAPFHGSRSGTGDHTSRFTGRAVPDGFGDAPPGDFAGASEGAGALVPRHPFYYRDAVRQAVVDWMQFIHVLTAGDWSALRAAAPALAELEFETARIGFVGLGLGADIGAILAGYEPSVTAIVLAFPEGSTIDNWALSPARSDREELAGGLFAQLGIDADAVGVRDALRRPDVDAWRALADRASALAYAPALRRQPVNALLFLARDDEVVHNAGSEALGHALGAVLIGEGPEYVPALRRDDLRPGMTLSGNLAVEGGSVTRVLFELDPATHGTLTFARGEAEFEHPIAPPFSRLNSPVQVDNPIAETLMQIAFYFESHRSCPATPPSAVCAAAVVGAPAD